MSNNTHGGPQHIIGGGGNGAMLSKTASSGPPEKHMNIAQDHKDYCR